MLSATDKATEPYRLRFSQWLEPLLVTILYAVVSIVVTWPTAVQLDRFMPGSSADTLLHYWNGWWVQTALSAGQSPFLADTLFYPEGVSLVTHNMAWMNILPWMILEPLLGGIVAYNIVLLVSLVLCGWACFLLARYLTHNLYAAFLAGAIYLAWPFRISQIDHPNLLSTFWVPLFFLGVIKTLDQGRRRDVIVTGVTLALVGYTRWQILIPVSAMALTYVLCRWSVWWPWRHGWRSAGRLLAAVGLALVLLLPPIFMLAEEQIGNASAADLISESDELVMQTDLLAYVTPPALNQLFSDMSRDAYDRYYPDRRPDRRFPGYIGLVAFILVVVGLVWRWRDSWPWLVVALVLVGLAAGPVLRFNGTLYEAVPTLYRQLMALTFVRLIRVPDRFNMFLALPVAIMAAFGLTAVLSHRLRAQLATGLRPLLLTGLLSLLVIAEYQTIPLKGHDVSYDKSIFQELAEEPGVFAVLNVPLWRGKEFMFDQTFHGRPIMQGNASRLPAGVYETMDDNPWLRRQRQEFAVPPPRGDTGLQLQTLAALGVRYLIVNKSLLDESQLAHWQRYLLAEPRYENEHIAVFSTTPEVGQDLLASAEPVTGLFLLDTFMPSDCLNPGQVLGLGAAWANRSRLDSRYEVNVSLLAEDETVTLSQRFPLSDQGPTEMWPAGSVGHGYYPLALDTDLPPGHYEIDLQLVRIPQAEPAGKMMAAGGIEVRETSCLGSEAANGQAGQAIFGDTFLLRDYVINQVGTQVVLDLHWLALQQPSREFKMFVHLIDPANGLPLAQTDTRPLNWEYPTSLWWSGQEVADQIIVESAGVDPGTYVVVVGIYEEANGERLTAVDANGVEIPDHALVLTTELTISGE